MIQVYKKNDLFVIENTITETIYPNLTREETVELLKKFDRDEPKDRCDFAIKEDNISFEYASLDDKDRKITDLETKLAAEKEYTQQYRKECAKSQTDYYQLKQQLAEKDKEIESLKHFKITIGTMENNQVDISSTTYTDQDKPSFALEQLEKVREFCEKELKECDKLLKTEFEDDFYIQSVMARESMCFDFRRTIDSQIKQLKGKK